MRLRSFALVLGLALAPLLPAQAGNPPTLNSPRPQVEPGAGGLPQRGYFSVRPAQHFNRVTAQALAAASATIPLWSHNITAGSTLYTYDMVGKDPFVVQSAPSTKIKAVVVPIRLTFTSFGNYKADPSAPDATCSPAGTASALTQASPIFQTITGTVWNTSVGKGQFTDLFQRANYNTQTSKSGINPNYHTILTYTTSPEIVINVSGGDVVAGGCGNLGLLDYSTWDNYLQTQLMPLLAAQSPQISPPNTLTIFLLYNVVLFDGSLANCCILGYHGAFNDPSYGGAFHTYVSVEFDTNQSFSGVSDISALSHEVAEWMDDPAGGNPTPSWGHVGQVSGCQANLEVGDPLSGTLSQIYMPANHYTYHVQDETFTSWFYGQQPSTGVNGWYSFLGNFLTPAAPC